MDDPVMVPVQSKNHKHKAVYTKDSEQTKYHKQSYWQMAEEGSGTLTNWVQVSHSPSQFQNNKLTNRRSRRS